MSENEKKNINIELSKTGISILQGKVCPYCRQPTQYVDSSIVYGRSFGMIYLCRSCSAYCGVHKGTDISLGRLADKELRYWKKEAHKYFDIIWKKKLLKREEAYNQLAAYLKLPTEYCHIGMFSIKTCQKVVDWSKTQLIANNIDLVELTLTTPHN